MEHQTPFTFIPPKGTPKPILISVPHAGTWIPPEDRRSMKESIWRHPPDTDWLVDRLYDFAPQLGIGMIVANISRYVIDLNRPVDDHDMYQDGRVTTGLTPVETFAGEELYAELVDLTMIKPKRVSLYYEPYHQAIERKLHELKASTGQALLIDAHSVKRSVPRIRSTPFPDIILGNNDGQTCDAHFVQLTQQILSEHFQVTLNDPFRGGQITRQFGNPAHGLHAFQIEMSQDLYLDETTDQLVDRHQQVRAQLEKVCQQLIEYMVPS
jgi:N-formylglutamate amidohydrolase